VISRRGLVAGLAGAALVRPLGAGAQGAVPVVGLLYPGTQRELEPRMAAFAKPLEAAGFAPGRSVAIDVRTADGQFDRLPQLSAALAQAKASVVVAASAAAAVAAPQGVPTVFIVATDPVLIGLVKSFPKPGGNATGVYSPSANAEAKRLQMLHQILPATRIAGILVDPSEATLARQIEQSSELKRAAPQMGLSLLFADVAGEADLGAAFEGFVRGGATAVLESINPAFAAWRGTIASLQIARRLPVIAVHREGARMGALASYDGDLDESFSRAGAYAARILQGERAADLPVVETTRFTLAVNLKTAQALGIAIAPSVLAGADEVFE
jgi:putative ABC transport system substrate-binding protein